MEINSAQEACRYTSSLKLPGNLKQFPMPLAYETSGRKISTIKSRSTCRAAGSFGTLAELTYNKTASVQTGKRRCRRTWPWVWPKLKNRGYGAYSPDVLNHQKINMKQLVQLIHSKLKTWYYYQELKESSLAILAVAACRSLYNYGSDPVKWALLRKALSGALTS